MFPTLFLSQHAFYTVVQSLFQCRTNNGVVASFITRQLRMIEVAKTLWEQMYAIYVVSWWQYSSEYWHYTHHCEAVLIRFTENISEVNSIAENEEDVQNGMLKTTNLHLITCCWHVISWNSQHDVIIKHAWNMRKLKPVVCQTVVVCLETPQCPHQKLYLGKILHPDEESNRPNKTIDTRRCHLIALFHFSCSEDGVNNIQAHYAC